jgi:hypothetical protein
MEQKFMKKMDIAKNYGDIVPIGIQTMVLAHMQVKSLTNTGKSSEKYHVDEYCSLA